MRFGFISHAFNRFKKSIRKDRTTDKKPRTTTDKTMNELSPTNPAMPTKPGQAESAALRDLVGLLNNPAITGAVVPPGENVNLPVVQLPSAAPTQQNTPPEPLPAAIPSPKENTQRIFFTGRFKSGKDHCAAAANYKIFGFAEPLYRIASYFFGVEVSATKGKDLQGMREFLQAIGQWGRGEINEKYPLNATRAAIIQTIRNFPDDLWPDLSVNWDEFGRNQNVWVDACIRRVNQHLLTNPESRIAITNVRFTNEFKALQSAGWVHFHCMCSSGTWLQRLAASGLNSKSPAANDMSEKLAADLDANVTKQISQHRQGSMLHAVWNDDIPSPSPRLYSLKTFLEHVA